MAAIEGSTDVSLTNLTPGFKQTNVEKNALDNVELNKQVSKANNDTRNNLVLDKEISHNSDATESTLTLQQLEKVAQQLQDFVGEMNRGLEFSVDKDSGRDVIKVIDKSSGDLVKQYPSEEVLTLVSKLSDMVGGFVDAKV
jgi:flagellar protein FlaG